MPRHLILIALLAAAGLFVTWSARRSETGTQQPTGPAAREREKPSLQKILARPDVIPSHAHPLLDRQAPAFELADVDGKLWSSEKLQGAPLVLIFFYGFHCDHCVRQLFDAHSDLSLFDEVGARVVALSADPLEVIRQRLRQNGPLGFPVLSDTESKVAKTYQVFQEGRMRHATFIIDRRATIRWVNTGDAPFRRNTALLSQVARLEGLLPISPRR